MLLKFNISLYVFAALTFNIGFSRLAFGQVPTDQAELSSEDAAVLKRGKISESKALTGAIVGTTLPIIPAYFLHSDQDDFGLRIQTSLLYTAFPAFGAGQLIQDRYLESGWWFTCGEAVLSALLYNSYRSNNLTSGYAAYEFFGLLGLRIWEIADLWKGPQRHNQRWQELMDKKTQQKQISFFIMPRNNGGQFSIGALLQWTW